MRTAGSELELYRHLSEVGAHLKQARDATGALRYSLRAAMDFFGANEACLAVLPPGASLAEVLFVLPYGGQWDLAFLTAFLSGERPAIPPQVMLARLRRRERPWGAIGLRRSGGKPFPKDTLRELARVAEQISEAIHRIDRERLLDVRARIDGKVMQQIPPKDLFYQILDGIRSLTGYDHSSSLLIHEGGGTHLRVVAEQIAWLKGKSLKIGLALPLTDGVRSLITEEVVYGFDRIDGQWRDWPDQQAPGLAALLDYNDGKGGSGSGVREGTMLCAPLTTRDGPLGVLKVAARHAGSFGGYEAGLLQRFTPLASLAIQNSQRTETLQARMHEAVRKHAIVDLARGVSHDVNNALGAVIPLVQQMHEEVVAGRIDATTFEKDLQDIERSLQICRRIFGGMLSFARGSVRRAGRGNVRRALEGTRGVLEGSLQRLKISLDLQIPDGLPPVKGRQGDLEQLFLNLITNARDATPSGGKISVRARNCSGFVEVVIEDTGAGIPAEILTRIQDPFFTTKPHGAGLGLSTCRWIIWEMRGELKIESEPGKGTRITMRLPLAAIETEGGM